MLKEVMMDKNRNSSMNLLVQSILYIFEYIVYY